MGQRLVLGLTLVLLSVALAGCTASDDFDSSQNDRAHEEGQEDQQGGGQGSAAPSAGPGALNTTESVESYTGHGVGAFAFNTGCEWELWEPGGPENLGGACFELERNTKKVEFKVEDDVTSDVGVYIRYDGSTDPEGFFCNEGSFHPPSDTRAVRIIIGDLGMCLFQDVVVAPTTGTITVTMYHE